MVPAVMNDLRETQHVGNPGFDIHDTAETDDGIEWGAEFMTHGFLRQLTFRDIMKDGKKHRLFVEIDG